MVSPISDDDLTSAYLLGAERMRDKLHKQADQIEKLREALKPFADQYQDNGLLHSMHIFEMKDLLAAKKVLGERE